MMINLALAFMVGIMYGLVGVNVAKKVESPINLVMLERGLSASWGIYISFMVTMLWPILVVIAAFTTGYLTIRSYRA